MLVPKVFGRGVALTLTSPSLVVVSEGVLTSLVVSGDTEPRYILAHACPLVVVVEGDGGRLPSPLGVA